MFGLIRRAWRSVTLTDETDTECDCEACTFCREVEALTAGHIVAAILTAPDLASALARASSITDAVTYAVDTVNHEWRLTADAVSEIDYLNDLHGLPAFGEESWSTAAPASQDWTEIDAYWDRIERQIAEDESTRDNPSED